MSTNKSNQEIRFNWMFGLRLLSFAKGTTTSLGSCQTSLLGRSSQSSKFVSLPSSSIVQSRGISNNNNSHGVRDEISMALKSLTLGGKNPWPKESIYDEASLKAMLTQNTVSKLFAETFSSKEYKKADLNIQNNTKTSSSSTSSSTKSEKEINKSFVLSEIETTLVDLNSFGLNQTTIQSLLKAEKMNQISESTRDDELFEKIQSKNVAELLSEKQENEQRMEYEMTSVRRKRALKMKKHKFKKRRKEQRFERQKLGK